MTSNYSLMKEVIIRFIGLIQDWDAYLDTKINWRAHDEDMLDKSILIGPILPTAFCLVHRAFRYHAISHPARIAVEVDVAVDEARHEELARLILDVDEASNEVVDVLDRRDLCLVDISEGHRGQQRVMSLSSELSRPAIVTGGTSPL